jgi:hypothetical protein
MGACARRHQDVAWLNLSGSLASSFVELSARLRLRFELLQLTKGALELYYNSDSTEQLVRYSPSMTWNVVMSTAIQMHDAFWTGGY